MFEGTYTTPKYLDVLRCRRCSITKPLGDFYNGDPRECKACKSERSRRWYQANREARRIKDREYQAAHLEQRNAARRRRKQETPL